MTKVITVNVNGIRSAAKKGIWDFLAAEDADIICLQELKAQEEDLSDKDKNPLNLHRIWHAAVKKGYSGVAIYSKQKPLSVQIGLGAEKFDCEGRFIRADFTDFTAISLYLPSGTSGAERQEFKYEFLAYFLPVLRQMLAEQKKIVICGDWNIAHNNIDLKNWRGNQKNSGFLPEERQWLGEVLALGWTDGWRQLYPEVPGYTWWSARGQAYQNDVGWRIDYQLSSPALAAALTSAVIYKEVKFSDHAPLIMTYNGV